LARILRRAWHEVYMDCVEPHTDMPLNFITWSALSLLGAALKNNVFFDIGTYTLYPNMFVVLVAPPGIGKGTAMNIIEDMNNTNKLNKVVNTLSDRITTEKIIESISNGWQQAPHLQGMQLVIGAMEHSCLIFSTELRTLLGGSNWMLEFLEEAWSKTSFDYQTKNKGSAFMQDACCSLLAASVPDVLRNIKRETQIIITGGFASRCLFIYAEDVFKDLPFPEPLKKNKKSKALWDNLLSDLGEISKLRGEFKMAPDARIILERYLTANKKHTADADSESEANFRARVKTHVIKLAIAFSVSKGDSLTLDRFDVSNAISEIDKVIGNVKKLFRGVGDSMDAVNVSRVQTFIEKHSPTTKKEMFSTMYRHLSWEDLDRILWILENIQFCTRQERGKISYYTITATGVAQIKAQQNGKVGP
jgi:hypothetical protein